MPWDVEPRALQQRVDLVLEERGATRREDRQRPRAASCPGNPRIWSCIASRPSSIRVTSTHWSQFTWTLAHGTPSAMCSGHFGSRASSMRHSTSAFTRVLSGGLGDLAQRAHEVPLGGGQAVRLVGFHGPLRQWLGAGGFTDLTPQANASSLSGISAHLSLSACLSAVLNVSSGKIRVDGADGAERDDVLDHRLAEVDGDLREGNADDLHAVATFGTSWITELS